MQISWFSLVRLLVLFCCYVSFLHTTTSSNVFTSSFLVRFRRNVDNKIAHDIANRNGFVNIGEVSDNIF